MARLKPWVVGPYELLRQAGLHRDDGDDFDRRMAMVNYDNAIELSVTTYLHLDPKQRSGRAFPREHVTQWLSSYHTKLDFLEHYVVHMLKQSMRYEKDDIIYFHKIRNELYHANGALVPRAQDVETIREIAHWVFATLYAVDIEPLLRADATEQPIEVPTRQETSLENQVLAVLLDLRKDIAQLKQESSATQGTTDEQVLDNVLGSEQGAASTRLKDALRRANQFAQTVREEQPIVASRDELDELISLLEELKQRVDIPLKAYQRKLAQRALDATLDAIAAQRPIIGHIYQSTGSGLSTTVVTYLSLVCEHPILRDFAILVVTDRTMLVEQLYHTIADARISGTRRILRATSHTLSAEVLRDPARIIVTTVQALRAQARNTPLAEQTLILAFGVNLFEHTATTHLLAERYVISFTHNLPTIATEGHLIGKYSLEEALRDGVLTPLTFEARDALLKEVDADFTNKMIPPVEEEPLRLVFESCAWTEARVRTIATDIIDHFTTRQNDSGGKAIVIASRLDDAARLCAGLRQTFFEKNRTPEDFVAVLNSSLGSEEVQKLMVDFNSAQSRPTILICGRAWMGMDLGAASCAYITCKLAPADLRQLAGQLATHRWGKRYATIVDYAANSPGDLPHSPPSDEI